jgi:hypothetical protein
MSVIDWTTNGKAESLAYTTRQAGRIIRDAKKAALKRESIPRVARRSFANRLRNGGRAGWVKLDPGYIAMKALKDGGTATVFGVNNGEPVVTVTYSVTTHVTYLATPEQRAEALKGGAEVDVTKQLVEMALNGELSKRADAIDCLLDILGIAERRANALKRRQPELLPPAAG